MLSLISLCFILSCQTSSWSFYLNMILVFFRVSQKNIFCCWDWWSYFSWYCECILSYSCFWWLFSFFCPSEGGGDGPDGVLLCEKGSSMNQLISKYLSIPPFFLDERSLGTNDALKDQLIPLKDQSIPLNLLLNCLNYCNLFKYLFRFLIQVGFFHCCKLL